MTNHGRFLRPAAWRVLVIALAVAAAPLPCLAGEAHDTVPAKPVLKTSIEKIAVSEAKALAVSPSANTQQSEPTVDKSKLESGNYFKSTAGIITLIAVGVGVGYALYSTSNDRIKSPKVPYEGGLR